MKKENRELLYSKELDRFLSARNLKKKDEKLNRKDERLEKNKKEEET